MKFINDFAHKLESVYCINFDFNNNINVSSHSKLTKCKAFENNYFITFIARNAMSFTAMIEANVN